MDSNSQMNSNTSSSTQTMTILYGYANNIGDKGSKKILKSLIKSSDAYQTINDLQNELSLSYNRINPALLFLESLGCNRSSAHHTLFNNIKTKLMTQLSNLNDDGLLKVLKQTFPFLIFNELKSVPLFIIKSLKKIPNAYLLKLSEGPYLKDLPLSIRRQAWQLNNPNFIESIKNQCESIVVLSDTVRLNEGHIKQLCEYIGTSENLFTTFANYCCKRSIEDNQPLWGSLLRQVLMGTQEGNNRIQSLGMLYEIAWIIDNCRRQNKLETKRFFDIIEKVKALVIVQAFQLSKRLNRPMITEKRLGNINHVLKVNENQNPKTALIRDSISKPTKGLVVKSRDHFSITMTDSNLIKSLKGAINYLVRMDEHQVFENRVDDSIAPGYSSFVKNPMEIATIKKKLLEYKSLDDLNSDVVLMFENCINYNGLESYYGMLADQNWKKWRAKLNKEKLSSSISETGNLTLQKALEEALKYLTSLDNKRYFASKVTDEMAPDYSKEIRNPMDFGSMKKKLATYSSFDSFDKDVQLVYDNCIHYNGIDSMLGAVASDHKNKWKDMKESLIKRIIIEGTSATSLPSQSLPLTSIPPTTERKSVSKPKKNDYGDEAEFEFSSGNSIDKPVTTTSVDNKTKIVSLSKGLDQAFNFLTDMDTTNVFAIRVTDEIAPGYSQIIKNPMDLSKIKKKLNGYTNLDEFDSDVVLMFDNCVKYNGRGSIFANLALDFKNKWNKLKYTLKERISYDAKNQGVVISSQGNTGDAPKIKLVLTLKKEEPPPAPKEVEKQNIPSLPTTKKDLPEVKTTFTLTADATKKEAIRSAIEFSWFYLIDLDKKGYFACPVTDLVAPGYSKVIDAPIDLSIIRVKIDRKVYKSIESFDYDVQLMLRNCFTYNNDSSKIYKDTEIFKETWDAELIAIKKVLGPYAIPANDVINQSATSLAPAKKRMRYGTIMEPVRMIETKSSTKLETAGSEEMEVSVNSNIDPNLENLINNISEEVPMDIETKPEPSSTVSKLKTEKIKAAETKAPKTISTVKRAELNEQVNNAISIVTNQKKQRETTSDSSRLSDVDDFLYDNSINAAKVIQDKSKEFEKFPEILTETKLMWAICMLRDSSIQNKFLEFLGSHIASLEGKIISVSGGKKSYKDFKLPYNDVLCKLLLQICQLSFYKDLNIHALDEKLIRVYLPLLILNVAQLKDDANNNDEEIKVIEKSKQIVNKIFSDEAESISSSSSNSDGHNKKKLLIVIAKILLSM